MNKYWKILVFAIGGVVFLILIKVIFDIPIRSKIPAQPDLQLLSDAQIDQLTNASRKAHIHPSADNLGRLGMVYHSASSYGKAATCYKLAITKNKTKWIWSYYLGYLYKEMGESADAIERFQTVIKQNPKAYHAWYYLGQAHQNMGANDKAIVAYGKISPWMLKEQFATQTARADFFSLDAYVKCQLASLYLNSDRLELAETTLNELTDKLKTFGWAYRLLGRVYRLKGDSISADKSTLRANDLLNMTSPVDTLIDRIALESRSELYLLKQIDEAEQFRYIDWERKLVAQGLKYMAENKYLVSKAIILYLKTNSGEQALPFLQQHFQVFNDDALDLNPVANLLFGKRYFAQSNLYYKRIIELQPENTDAQVNLVLGLVYQREKERAIELMEEFIQKDSSNSKVYANAVVEMLAIEDYQKAELYLEQLKQLAPSGFKTMLLLGKMEQQKGNLPQAQAFYEAAFKENPKDLICMKALSDVLMRQKLWLKAKTHFKTSLEFFPNEPYLLEILGTLLVVCPDTALRNYDEGKEFLERAFFHKDCPPEISIVAGQSLAEVYISLGDKQTALAYLAMAIDMAKSIEVDEQYVAKLINKQKQLH